MPSNIEDLGLKILFLLMPGIIAFGIIKSLGPKRPRSDFESGLQIFVYGVVCYLIVGLLEGLYLWKYARPAGKTFWATIADSSLGLATLNTETGLALDQIVYATIVAILVGCVVSPIQAHSVPHSILRGLGLTKRTNEVDIWELALNSPSISSWVTVRHHVNGKVYQGWVRGYSDGGSERELLLADVAVFVTSEAELVQVNSIPVLYLGLDRKNTVLELQNVAT